MRQATLLLTRRPERLQPEQRALLAQLHALDSGIATAHRLAAWTAPVAARAERAGRRVFMPVFTRPSRARPTLALVAPPR